MPVINSELSETMMQRQWWCNAVFACDCVRTRVRAELERADVKSTERAALTLDTAIRFRTLRSLESGAVAVVAADGARSKLAIFKELALPLESKRCVRAAFAT
jgi:hypothetical protein